MNENIQIILSEFEQAWDRWSQALRDSLSGLRVADFLPRPDTGFLPPVLLNMLSALSSLPDEILAALAAASARFILPVVGRDSKLHQKVIPVDRVLESYGPALFRRLLGRNPVQDPAIAKPPFGTIRAILFRRFQPLRFLSGVIESAVIGFAAKTVSAGIKIGITIGIVIVIVELDKASRGTLLGVLQQSNPRKKLRCGPITIYRQNPAPIKPGSRKPKVIGFPDGQRTPVNRPGRGSRPAPGVRPSPPLKNPARGN